MNTWVALVQAGAVLAVSVVIRALCARHLTLEMVPTALRPRVVWSNRVAPVMLLVGGVLVVFGALLGLAS
jgi:multisubunit Na+/H+ antiporter MnhB subunit